MRTGNLKEAGKVAEVRGEVTTWFLDLLKGRGSRMLQNHPHGIEGAKVQGKSCQSAGRLLRVAASSNPSFERTPNGIAFWPRTFSCTGPKHNALGRRLGTVKKLLLQLDMKFARFFSSVM